LRGGRYKKSSKKKIERGKQGKKLAGGELRTTEARENSRKGEGSEKNNSLGSMP